MEFADYGDLYKKIVQKQKNKTHFKEIKIWSVLIQIA